MMRLALSSAASGLLRALLRRADADAERILLSDCRSVDWQSLTFIGERHQLRFRITGADGAALAARFVDGLGEAEFTLPGQVVADIAAGTPRTLGDGSVEVEIEALTIAS